MTAVDIARLSVRSRDAGTADSLDAAELTTGLIERVRLAGLRLAGFEAWAAGACALAAVGILFGLGHLAVALINPAMEAVVPVHCGTSIDCAMQTLGLLP